MQDDRIDDTRYRLGARVRELRRTAGLTQEQVAERWGASPVTISKIENGRMNPGAWGLPSLAACLGCSVGDLFDHQPHGDVGASGSMQTLTQE